MDSQVVHDYDSFLRSFSDSSPLLNGYVVQFMHFNLEKIQTRKCRQLAVELNLVNINDSVVFQKLYFAVSKLLKDVLSRKKYMHRNWDRIVDILNRPFAFQPLVEDDITTHDLSLSERVVVGSEDVSVLDVSTSEVSELNTAVLGRCCRSFNFPACFAR